MKIGQTQDAAAVDGLRGGSRRTGRTEPVGKSPEVDSVKLSSASRQLGAADLTVRAEKVAALRKLIAEGKYQMDHEAIADNMIAESTRLIQALGLPGRAS